HDGEDIAHLAGALILEERARAVAPQRVRIVGRRLRRRHRHLHRLVARPRLRIVDRRQLRLFADLADPVDRGAATHQRGQREDTGNRQWLRAHDQQMTLRHVSSHVQRYATDGGGGDGAGVSASLLGFGSAAVDTRMLTRFGPVTVPWIVRFDWMLRTLITSPSAPDSRALPRVVSRMPGTS